MYGVHRKSSDKGHKRTNSDGTIKFNTSASCEDLTTRDTTTATTTSATAKQNGDSCSPRRRSVMVVAADTESLGSVDYNKPEVHIATAATVLIVTRPVWALGL